MLIRTENQNDFAAIYDLVKTAFETSERSDGHEQDFVNNLRTGPNYIPDLSLVAEYNDKLAGHIMLSKTTVRNQDSTFDALLLGPVAVVLEYRDKGIGSELIRTSMQKAREMGYKAVFLAGNPAYYKRFGFVPAGRFDIKANVPVPEELLDCIMACQLCPNALSGISGVVTLC